MASDASSQPLPPEIDYTLDARPRAVLCHRTAFRLWLNRTTVFRTKQTSSGAARLFAFAANATRGGVVVGGLKALGYPIRSMYTAARYAHHQEARSSSR